MRNLILFHMLAGLISVQAALADDRDISTAGSDTFLSASSADTLIDSGAGKLRKIFSLKSIIKDIPDGMIAGAVFDHKQRLYVATYGIGRFEAWTIGKKPIYRIETDGSVSVFAEVTCGLLKILGVDAANSIYVTVTNGMNATTGTDIFKITEDGEISPYATGYYQPCSGIFDPDGNLYFVDAQQKKIFRITPQNTESVILDINTSSLSAGLLFHGMAFDSSFSTCYLVGYALGYGKVLRCSVSRDWRMGPLSSICSLPSPAFAWVDRKNVVYVTCVQNQIAKISPDGSWKLYNNTLYGSMLDDFNRTMYIISPDCQLYQILDEASVPVDSGGADYNAAPRIIDFSLGRDSLSCGSCLGFARVEDESCCDVRMFILHDGKSDSLILERDSRDSSFYSLAFDGYSRGDSLAVWLLAVDEQNMKALSDTIDFCFMPFMASDLDDDGGLDVLDLLAFLRILSGSAQPSAWQRCSGDMDSNGTLDIFDMLAMLKLLASN